MTKLLLGDPAPWFSVRSSVNANFHFQTVAGRYLVLCFYGSAVYPESQVVLARVYQHPEIFDDDNCSFFGVSVDPEDEKQQRVTTKIPGFRFFWDFDYQVSRLYQVITTQNEIDYFTPCSIVLDAGMRIIRILPIKPNPENHVRELLEFIKSLPPVNSWSESISAPVLAVPHVFEQELCRTLIDLYERQGGGDSGFMQEVNGQTVGVIDYGFKRRQDCLINDQVLLNHLQTRIRRRLLPEIKKAFQFEVTRIERHIVACYDADTGGYFRAHRDNTTKGTAHRKFAVTINLNAEDYEGGELRFPEFGQKTYRASTGGAIVFSCTLLHEATPVIKGRRYAYLPFLYNEEAAQVRRNNQQFLSGTTINKS